MLTATTVPLILLLILLWKYTRGNVLAIVLFTSIFEAASPLNFGMLGVPPWLFALAVCGVVKLTKGFSLPKFTVGINRPSLHLMFAFILYTVMTGMFYPILFHGVPVIHDSAATPLTWSKFNFTQICYLLAAAVVYLLAVTSTRDELKLAVAWYQRGCVTASIFAFYQLANAIAHVPYPSIVLYSNPGHMIYHAYQINGMWRLNSTFPEASEMATFLTVGVGLLGWEIVTRPLRMSSLLPLALMLAALLMTQSSLGYASLAFILAASSVIAVKRLTRDRGLSPGKVLIGLGIVGVVVLLFATTNAGSTVNKVINSVLLEKTNSVSYKERTATHVAAELTASKTYYMGAGWGSVRASGLGYMLLGNVGIPGSALFCVFVLSLLLPLLKRQGHRDGDDLFEQSLFALGIILLGLAMAGSEPVQPILWALFGLATAGRTIRSRTSLNTSFVSAMPISSGTRRSVARFSDAAKPMLSQGMVYDS